MMNKKKIVTSLLTLSVLSPIVAESVTENIPQDQITYVKDFSLQVYKEPKLVIDLPTESVVEIAIDEILESIDIPVSINTPSEGVAVTEAPEIIVGEMGVSTSAESCKASISTVNDFKLVGKEKGFSLFEYEMLYTAGEGSPVTHTFGSNHPNLQDVACSTASLDMQVIKAFGGTPADDYDDVIRVSVEAES